MTERSARLLIVDDEAAQMKALCNTLRDEGYTTTGFSSPREALGALRTQRFDLVLTDLMMPEMDGITLLRSARELDPDLLGIMMTGHATVDTAVEAMKVGAQDYITKPFKLGVILSVLDRVLALRRLQQENAELARRVNERTAELEVANKELESFSYSVAHDLRAPLRAVNGFGRILSEDFAASWPAEAQRLLGLVIGGAERMGHLIDDLLRFSRLGRQPISRRTVNPATMVQDVLDELRAAQPGRRVEVTVAPLPDYFADPSLLKQVFVNLLSNAFKFTRTREPAVIEVGQQQQDGQDICFVRDNGAGFDMQFAEKLFGVFQRLHGEEEFEGTGVGLSIVHRIIHRHGGRIWAESAPGKGATFFFTLPREKAVAP